MKVMKFTISKSNDFENSNLISPKNNEEIVIGMLQELKNSICLDESREIFARDAFETITALVNGKLRKNDRYRRRILIGQKAVGKTTLLDALMTVAKKHFSKGLVCVRINYTRVKYARLPIDHVIDALGPCWQVWWYAEKVFRRKTAWSNHF